jgi:tetratricopeptide (TPR) repeat protein
MDYAAHFRMRNDESVAAFERALGYFRLVGDSALSVTVNFEWALILSPRAADEGLRMLDELAPGRPPGDGDLTRAVLLAQLGRFDEAWPLAEAQSDHLREVTGDAMADGHLAAIAMLEGDRQRACRHHLNLIDALPPGSDGTAATWRLPLARDLCYLGRLGEAERELRQAQVVAAGPVERALGPAVEALLLAARGELEQAEGLARASIAAAETETDNPWLQGWGYEDLATVLERAGRIDEAREALERAVAVWERKRCLPYVARLREQIDTLGRAKI